MIRTLRDSACHFLIFTDLDMESKDFLGLLLGLDYRKGIVGCAGEVGLMSVFTWVWGIGVDAFCRKGKELPS